jgi:acyl-coenzyme A thioesterase PaaI-like protein
VDQPLSIQERYFPDLTCFGCGPANPKGLQLRSLASDLPGDEAAIASFLPWPEHDNGLGYLNGGIIGTVLDCHGFAAVTLEVQRRGWVEPDDALLPYVTAGLDIRFRRPAPLVEPSQLRAVVVESDPDQMTVEVELAWDGKPRATATALWKRWRPR